MQFAFDATQFDPRQSEGGICLPYADYYMEVISINPVEAKDSTPQNKKGFFEFSLKVLAGEFTGAIQKDRLNMWGQGETATKIAYQNLAAYCYIAGKPHINDSNELVGMRLIATCGPQESNEKYSEVKSRKDLAGNVPVQGKQCAPQGTTPSLPTQTSSAASPSASNTNPWSNPASAQATQPPANAWNTQPQQGQAQQQQPSNPWNNAGGSSGEQKPPWVK